MTFLIILPFVLIVLFYLLYNLAKSGILFMFPQEGTITAIVKGDSYKRFIVNIKGHHLDDESGKIVKSDPSHQPPKRWLGLEWVGIPPFYRVHTIKIDALRLVKGKGDNENTPISEFVEHEEKKIHNLRWKFPRPIVVTNVELKDRFKINVLVIITFEVVDPYIPIFVLGGDFLDLIDSAIESAVIDFCKETTYEEFVKLSKGKADEVEGKRTTSAFTKRLLLINKEGTIGDDTVADGIEEGVGIVASDAYIHRYDLSKESAEADKAVQAKEIARLNAQAKVKTAKGDRKAKEQVGKGEANRAIEFMAAFISKGVHPNVAADAYREFLRTENLGKISNLSTLVEGGSNAGVMITPPAKSGNTDGTEGGDS